MTYRHVSDDSPADIEAAKANYHAYVAQYGAIYDDTVEANVDAEAIESQYPNWPTDLSKDSEESQ